MLVAEPERLPRTREGARWLLAGAEKTHGPADRLADLCLRRCRQVGCPGRPGAQGVRGQIRAAAVEGQLAPAAAKRRHATVAVLQVQQPLGAGRGGLSQAPVRGGKVPQGEQRSGGVVRIRHATRQVSPGPPSRRGVGIGMALPILLAQQPIEERVPRENPRIEPLNLSWLGRFARGSRGRDVPRPWQRSGCQVHGGGDVASSPSSAPRASPLTARVVSQVARLVSMGQLPSARAEASRKPTPRRTTGCAA